MTQLKCESDDGFRSPEILAVIPSIGGAGYSALVNLQKTLDSVQSISCVVVSNSQGLTDHLQSLSVPVVTDGSNRGFGHSVSLGAGTSETWDWLLIVNDDIELDVNLFKRAVTESLGSGKTTKEIVYFDADSIRPIPKRLQVFLQVSLLGKVVRTSHRRVTETANSYRSFSCVAISREIFELNAGFDSSLVFTYEDADFVSRATLHGVKQRCSLDSGVTHSHSVSSGKYVDTVLPVATYSAGKYLDKQGSHHHLNTAIILAALVFRVLFVPMTRSPKKKHVKGIFYSVVAVVNRQLRCPQLPVYSEL